MIENHNETIQETLARYGHTENPLKVIENGRMEERMVTFNISNGIRDLAQGIRDAMSQIMPISTGFMEPVLNRTQENLNNLQALGNSSDTAYQMIVGKGPIGQRVLYQVMMDYTSYGEKARFETGLVRHAALFRLTDFFEIDNAQAFGDPRMDFMCLGLQWDGVAHKHLRQHFTGDIQHLSDTTLLNSSYLGEHRNGYYRIQEPGYWGQRTSLLIRINLENKKWGKLEGYFCLLDDGSKVVKILHPQEDRWFQIGYYTLRAEYTRQVRDQLLAFMLSTLKLTPIEKVIWDVARMPEQFDRVMSLVSKLKERRFEESLNTRYSNKINFVATASLHYPINEHTEENTSFNVTGMVDEKAAYSMYLQRDGNFFCSWTQEKNDLELSQIQKWLNELAKHGGDAIADDMAPEPLTWVPVGISYMVDATLSHLSQYIVKLEKQLDDERYITPWQASSQIGLIYKSWVEALDLLVRKIEGLPKGWSQLPIQGVEMVQEAKGDGSGMRLEKIAMTIQAAFIDLQDGKDGTPFNIRMERTYSYNEEGELLYHEHTPLQLTSDYNLDTIATLTKIMDNSKEGMQNRNTMERCGPDIQGYIRVMEISTVRLHSYIHECFDGPVARQVLLPESGI